MREQLKAFADAVCQSLAVDHQAALDASITPAYRAEQLSRICDQLRVRPDVLAASHDREWDNIFAVIVKVELREGRVGKEQLSVWMRLSEVFPIACTTWMITNNDSPFAALDPPITIVQSYTGRLSTELCELEAGLHRIAQINGYLVVQPEVLNFSMGEPLQEETADRRQITGTSFFFG